MSIDYVSHNKSMHQLFVHTATVYTAKTTHPTQGVSPNITNRSETFAILGQPKYENIPCYVEFEEVGTLEAVGDIPTVTRKITLICDEEYDIPQGAILDVNRFGHVDRFRSAGMADHLGSHQEITLKTVDYAKGG